MIVKLDCLYNRLCMIQIWTACISETVLGRKDLAERSSMIFWGGTVQTSGKLRLNDLEVVNALTNDLESAINLFK